MNRDEIVDIMQQSSLFGDAQIPVDCVRIRKCRKGQIISDKQQARQMGSLVLVVKGRVDVYSISMDGREIVLSTLTPGECFGLINLFTENELPTVLKCHSETTILSIPKQTFIDTMEHDRGLTVRYARLCNQKMQFLLQRIELLTMQSGRNKVIQYLLMCRDSQNVVKLKGSKEDLAAALGISRASLFREISALQEQKLIQQQPGGQIILLDLEKLEHLQSFS